MKITPVAAFAVLHASTIYGFSPSLPSAMAPSFITTTRTPNHSYQTTLFATIEDPKTKGLEDWSGNTVPASLKQTTVASVPVVAQRWRKSTKQLATLGPASSSKDMIEKLFLAGADVFRLNFSHGSQEQKKELLITIREIEEKYSHPIAILGDLQGPKLRVRSEQSKINVQVFIGNWLLLLLFDTTLQVFAFLIVILLLGAFSTYRLESSVTQMESGSKTTKCFA